MPITRTQKLFGVAMPAAVSLLALGMVTGACALKESAAGRGEVSVKAPALAQLAAAYTKHLDRSVTRSSRTFAAMGSQPFHGVFGALGALANSAADTPLDQLLGEGDRPLLNNGLCPPDMASIDDRYCVDRYEATVLEVMPSGEERPFSSFEPLE